MRIFNEDEDDRIQNVLFLLTKKEATNLRDELDKLITSEKTGAFKKVNDADYRKEISVAIYDKTDYANFDGRMKRLIREDR